MHILLISDEQGFSGLSDNQNIKAQKEELGIKENQGQDISREGMSSSAQTGFKSGVSFAQNLVASTPKKINQI